MINNLFDEYEKHFNWKSYYDIPIRPEELFPTEGINGPNACHDFIREHFSRAGKGDVFKFDFEDIYANEGKHEHTVALYLLGLNFKDLFYYNVGKQVKSYIANAGEWYHDRDFMYTWFMACLYHDTASCIERTKSSELKKFNCSKDKIQKAISIKGYSNKYSAELIRSYYRYRKSDGIIDHGIRGGLLLNEKLKGIFKEKTKDVNWESNDSYFNGGLVWRKEHLEHYNYVSEAVICHNIWTISDNDRNCVKRYHEYGLDELVIDDERKKLFIEEYPLIFMLCLLDSIEPVKRFATMQPRDILENILITIEENNNESLAKIRISWGNSMKSKSGFWDWMKNIYGLPEWMGVSVSDCEKGTNECYLYINIL